MTDLMGPITAHDQTVRTATTPLFPRTPTQPTPPHGFPVHGGLRTPEEWHREAVHVLSRPRRSRRPPVVAALHVVERERIESRLGHRGLAELLDQLGWLIDAELGDADRMGLDGHGGLSLLLCHTPPQRVPARLEGIVARVTRQDLLVSGERVRVTPVVGWSTADDDPDHRDSSQDGLLPLSERATVAAEAAARQLDLVPRRWTPELARAAAPRRSWLPSSLRTTLQVLATLVIGVALPFLALVGMAKLGIDLGMPLYYLVTAALVGTATLIWVEGFRALDPATPPDRPATAYPAASAIIPAYLPNEAATIIETLHRFLVQDYPGPLQVVLAYNTPHPLPAVEEEIAEIARADRRLVVLKVPFSTSKAQNVNAALQVVTGDFTGIFDADHHPRRDAFSRAWRWISHDTDVVQGHCVIRNGRSSLVARTVAVEFESIYAVSHPGRADLHGFGLFGGSNGFWRTSVLHKIRMQGEMLTEDIDSSIRLVLSGLRCVSDPGLLSYELAPATPGALWNQRMRWAQGWFQVSRRHLGPALRSPNLTVRNKVGMAFLLGWRELYPWLSLLVMPVIGYLAWRAGGIDQLDFLVPGLLLATLYTLAVGPGQTLFAWRLAAPEVRRHGRWFLGYLLVASIFYSEFRNVIGRVAHLKELTGERRWVITPRRSGGPEEVPVL